MGVKLLPAICTSDVPGVALHFIPIVIPIGVTALRIAVLPELHLGNLNDPLAAVEADVFGLFLFFEFQPAHEGFDGTAGQAHCCGDLRESLTRLP
jgi:hypothetical protein